MCKGLILERQFMSRSAQSVGPPGLPSLRVAVSDTPIAYVGDGLAGGGGVVMVLVVVVVAARGERLVYVAHIDVAANTVRVGCVRGRRRRRSIVADLCVERRRASSRRRCTAPITSFHSRRRSRSRRIVVSSDS